MQTILCQKLAKDKRNYAVVNPKCPDIPMFEVPKYNIKENISIFFPHHWSFENFLIGRHLGKGGFGHIYLAKEKSSGYIVALKVQFKKQLQSQGLQNSIIKQIQIHSHLNHPNIVKMFGFFQDNKRIIQIIEFVSGGQLYGKLKKQRYFKECEAAKYVYQLMNALEYMHNNKIIHRDIKPENLLLDENDNIKLSDFGFSTQINTKRRKSYVGTTDYLSPEILGKQFYGQTVDIWCVGVLTYELNAGSAPFTGLNCKQTQDKIKLADYKMPERFSLQLKDFIKSILSTNYTKRPKIQDLLHHSWILKNKQFF